jgi:hypothetical protein
MSKKTKRRLLPATNSNEDLETLSQAKLILHFTPRLFEIRQQTVRDKGLDLTVEVKQDGVYTNFQFAIQLKATTVTSLNSDGSLSLSVNTSNIHYLLNYGRPVYYILYHHKTDTFYFEHIFDVYRSLQKKYANRTYPQTFTIRFSKVLTPESIELIYENTLQIGMLYKRINDRLDARLAPMINKGLIIDEHLEVYNTEENIAFIESFGFFLINQRAFQKIIDIEQKTYHCQGASATFNLVCGFAYHAHTNLFKAFEFLKLAQKNNHELDADKRSVLTYMLLNTRYLLSILSNEQYLDALHNLAQDEKINHFLRLQHAYKILTDGEGNVKTKLHAFYRTTNEIISEDPNNVQLLFLAYDQVLHAEAKVLTYDLANNFFLFCGKVSDPFQTQTYHKWSLKELQYTSRLLQLQKFALKEEDFLAMANLSLHHTHWLYQKAVIRHVLAHWNSQTLTVESIPFSNDIHDVLRQLDHIKTIVNIYELLNNKENLVACLLLKYELQLFVSMSQEAKQTADTIGKIINAYELNSFCSTFERLLSGNNAQQRFVDDLRMRITQVTEIMTHSGHEDFMQAYIPNELQEQMAEDEEWTIDHFPELRLP